MITVVGWPRSGAHWLKAMLEHALGEELAHSHFWPEEEGEYVLIVRDPRDCFASHWRLYQRDNQPKRPPNPPSQSHQAGSLSRSRRS